MNEAIKNIFKTAEPEKRICTVSFLLTAGMYHVTDQSGRIYRVESEQFWRPGDAVIIQNGRIVARAAQVATPKIYEV